MALEAVIGADITDLNKKIKEAEFNLQQLANEKAVQIKIGLDTKEIDKNIKSVKSELSSLKTTLRDTGQAFGKDFAPKVANGSNAMTQFNRIIQDAPFGPMGVQNNITAFGEAFGYLVKETGSAKAAFGAMVGSLVGSGGVMLAISAVTSGLTYMSQKGLTVGDVFDKLVGKFDEARRSMQELAVETTKNSQAQISSVGAYVAAAKNINLSMEDRLLAVKKLQDEYPAYFGNLSKEQILNGNVANAVRGVTMALIAKAKAAATVDRIVKLAEEEEKLQNEINNALASTARQYKLNKKEAFEFAVVMNKQLRGEIDLLQKLEDAQGKGGTSNFTKAEKTALATLKISSGYLDASEKLINLRREQDRYTESLEKSVAASIKLETEKEKSGKKQYGKLGNFDTLDSSITKTGLDGLVSLSGMVTQIAKNVQGAEGVISTSLKKIPAHFQGMSVEAMQALIDFNTAANTLIKGAITDTFVSFGESIGAALTSGTNFISSFGKSILGIFGNLLAEFGKMLIKLGTGLVVADLALKSGNGYAAIAAGVALVAVASAFKSNSSKLSTSSAAGSSSGGYSSGASYSSPSSSGGGNGSSSFGNGTVVFEIAGDRLIGVLQNTINKNKRLGGSLGL